jgi:hypothetical protein
METPDEKRSSSHYRISVQDIEQHLATRRVYTVEAEWEVEHMFSLLNSGHGRGKSGARMCKILNSLSEFFRGPRQRRSGPFYLLEGKRFRDALFLWVGLRIAFLLHLPVVARICPRKV